MRLRFVLLLLASLALLKFSYFPAALKSGEPDGGREEQVAVSSETVPTPPDIPEFVTREFRVKKGDTLYGILKNLGIQDSSIMSLAAKRVEGIRLSRLIEGRPYRIISRDDMVLEYQYEPDEKSLVRVDLAGVQPEVVVEPIPYSVRTVAVTGTIEDSLFGALDDSGEEPALAMDLAEIFAWQIDFFRDLRKDDSFTVLVDKLYRDGRFIRYGSIQAAVFSNAGKRFTAFLFDPDGNSRNYFDENGESLRKQFLKAPLRFRRISSGFSRRRLHPVTGKVSPHLGVDYVAPIGTPVRAIGDGKIVLKRRDSVNGRIVKVRHNSTYSSAYAHLNSFASGIRPGQQVKQGQIIGYLGRSGRATGPHLHFAMYRNGKYVDPRKIKVPRAASLASEYLPTFRRTVVERMALLEGKEPSELLSGMVVEKPESEK
ncbi:MAG: peptidoglycan DD-metalloendopeptidase family protein [bacterium]|nr:MAG: peptidoglycan DD-metalloendopeptidase family protein [bacterium]